MGINRRALPRTSIFILFAILFIFDNAFSQEPIDASTKEAFNMGVGYIEQGNYDDAIASFTKAIEPLLSKLAKAEL